MKKLEIFFCFKPNQILTKSPIKNSTQNLPEKPPQNPTKVQGETGQGPLAHFSSPPKKKKKKKKFFFHFQFSFFSFSSNPQHIKTKLF